MDEPDVSVVVPTFRREATLGAAVRSALDQQGVVVEVLVLDDSPEGSAAAAIRVIDDPRLQYRHRAEPSGGRPALVRNEGLALARGRYVHFLDDDDMLEEGALAALVGALDAAPTAGVAIGVVVPFGDDPVVLAQQRAYFADAAARLRATRGRFALTAAMLFGSTPLINSACLVRRECARRVGGYADNVPRCEDVDFYLRAVRACGFVFVDRPVLRYRTGAPSLMHSLRDNALVVESYRAIHARYRRGRGRAEFLALRLLALWRRRRGAHRLALALLLVAPVVTILAGDEALRVWRRERARLHPPRAAVTLPAGVGPFLPVVLRTSDGLVLRGSYLPSRDGAAVVLGHGWGGQRGQLGFEARALARRGFGVLLFDWRGHGESDGVSTTWGAAERRDLEAAVDYLASRPDVRDGRIGALGFSMGANVVAVVAAHDMRLRGIVLEGAFTSLADMLRHDESRYGWWSEAAALLAVRRAGVELDSVRPAAMLCRVSPRPVLIVNGAEDADTPVATARQLFAAACSPKELFIVPGADHHDYAVGGDALAARLGTFFERALLSPPARGATSCC